VNLLFSSLRQLNIKQEKIKRKLDKERELFKKKKKKHEDKERNIQFENLFVFFIKKI
jgi:hypothetical protein